jgi:hypothetical protein
MHPALQRRRSKPKHQSLPRAKLARHLRYAVQLAQTHFPPLPRWLYSVRAGTTHPSYTLFYACVLLCSSLS